MKRSGTWSPRAPTGSWDQGVKRGSGSGEGFQIWITEQQSNTDYSSHGASVGRFVWSVIPEYTCMLTHCCLKSLIHKLSRLPVLYVLCDLISIIMFFPLVLSTLILPEPGERRGAGFICRKSPSFRSSYFAYQLSFSNSSLGEQSVCRTKDCRSVGIVSTANPSTTRRRDDTCHAPSPKHTHMHLQIHTHTHTCTQTHTDTHTPQPDRGLTASSSTDYDASI